MSIDALHILATKRAYCREREVEARKPKIYQAEEMILHFEATFTSSVTNLTVDYFAKPASEGDSGSVEETTTGKAAEIVLNALENGIELPVWRS